MKPFLSVAVLVLAASIPAYGQMGQISSLTLNPMPANIHMLPHYSPANPQMLAVSGNATEFFPSTFLPFNEAVDRGTAIDAMNRKRITLVEVARETRAARKNPAKALFVQDDRGNAILIKEKN